MATQRRTRSRKSEPETPETPATEPEGQATPETPETPATEPEGQENPATGQTEMEGDGFDPRKAAFMEELFQLFHEREARNAYFEFHSQTSFIVDLTDDELEAFLMEVKAAINERGLKRVVERDFDALQSMVSEVLTSSEGETG